MSIKGTEGNYAKPRVNFTATTTTDVIFSRGRAAAEVTVSKNVNSLGAFSTQFTATGSNVEGSITNATTSFTFPVRTTNANWNSNTTINVTTTNLYGTSPSFEIVTQPNFPGIFGIEALIVGGGGAGGGNPNTLNSGGSGGGGGAGGYREFSQIAVTTGIAFPIALGGGGAAVQNGNGNKGSNSLFREIVGEGGGGGARRGTQVTLPNNSSPGAVGNQSNTFIPVTSVLLLPDNFGNIELYTAGGNPAGAALLRSIYSPGGGGASAIGGNSNSTVAGAGGAGRASNITGSSITRGGGGGGGSGGTGGDGGGGNGGTGANGSAATANTGGGGGGCGNIADGIGGNGGSGLVILKVPNTYNATFSAGVTSSLSTSVAGFNIYSVTATSTTSETVTFSVA
jgi:hypothetical protein